MAFFKVTFFVIVTGLPPLAGVKVTLTISVTLPFLFSVFKAGPGGWTVMLALPALTVTGAFFTPAPERPTLPAPRLAKLRLAVPLPAFGLAFPEVRAPPAFFASACLASLAFFFS